MNDCGCFYCKDCNHDSGKSTPFYIFLTLVVHVLVVSDSEQVSCVACGKKKIKSYDIRDKKQLREIETNITDPALLLNRAVNAIRF